MNLCWALWAIWYGYWIVSARNRVRNSEGAPAKREPLAGRLAYLGLMVLGFFLLFARRPLSYLSHRLWPSSGVGLYCGLAIQIAGLAFAIWARFILGKNWSGRVTIGARQELIVCGPYRLVRHPIYSGLLTAVLGTAIALGEVRGFVGLMLVVVSVLVKLRREERVLRSHFGEAYRRYAARVPGLIPGWRVSMTNEESWVE